MRAPKSNKKTGVPRKTVEERQKKKSCNARDWAGLQFLRVVPHVTVSPPAKVFSSCSSGPSSAEVAAPIEIHFLYFLLCFPCSLMINQPHMLQCTGVAMWRCTSTLALSHTSGHSTSHLSVDPARNGHSHTSDALQAEVYVGFVDNSVIPLQDHRRTTLCERRLVHHPLAGWLASWLPHLSAYGQCPQDSTTRPVSPSPSRLFLVSRRTHMRHGSHVRPHRRP